MDVQTWKFSENLKEKIRYEFLKVKLSNYYRYCSSLFCTSVAAMSQVTVFLFILFSLLVTAKQYFGDPIGRIMQLGTSSEPCSGRSQNDHLKWQCHEICWQSFFMNRFRWNIRILSLKKSTLRSVSLCSAKTNLSAKPF